MSKQLDPRSIRVLEDALSGVVRDAHAATKDLRAALNDGRSMMAEIVREQFTETAQKNVDAVMEAMFDKVERLIIETSKSQLQVVEDVHKKIFESWAEEEVAEVMRVARMIVTTREKLRQVLTEEQMKGGDDSFDPLKLLADMGNSSVKLIAKQVNAGITYSGIQWEAIDVDLDVDLR